MRNNLFKISVHIEDEIGNNRLKERLEIKGIINRLIKSGIPPNVGYAFYSDVFEEIFTLDEIVVGINFINYFLSYTE